LNVSTIVRRRPRRVAAPDGDAHAEEHAPHEEAGGELVGVEPGRAQIAADDVGDLDEGEAEEEQRAQHHEGALQRIEERPLQMPRRPHRDARFRRARRHAT